ncbi:hypothetical protein GBAR_LOCUS26639 [Geodia barretti]|uniref:Uncharacterized protein n=1 Tax=Geodia barretti TaxID=519541 RepID=A0AA35TIN2_GEOBA|nr:hypothetical protein GBAR_LOCUS26639 [Geodia barretti]
MYCSNLRLLKQWLHCLTTSEKQNWIDTVGGLGCIVNTHCSHRIWLNLSASEVSPIWKSECGIFCNGE